jgi:hypothetical protein
LREMTCSTFTWLSSWISVSVRPSARNAWSFPGLLSSKYRIASWLGGGPSAAAPFERNLRNAPAAASRTTTPTAAPISTFFRPAALPLSRWL